jgi:hypothetical protein
VAWGPETSPFMIPTNFSKRSGEETLAGPRSCDRDSKCNVERLGGEGTPTEQFGLGLSLRLSAPPAEIISGVDVLDWAFDNGFKWIRGESRASGLKLACP